MNHIPARLSARMLSRYHRQMTHDDIETPTGKRRTVNLLGLARHLLAILALPFVVTVLIPIWVARANGTVLRLGATGLEMLTQVGGLVFLTIGLALFVSSLRKFANDGQGTLAPWDPPRRLVVRGPYRYVRN